MNQLRRLEVAAAVGVSVLVLVALYGLLSALQASPSSCTNCVKGTLSTGSGSGSAGNGIAYDGETGNLFVSSSDLDSWSVSVINGSTDAVSTVVPDSGRPLSLAYDARNGDLYVANWRGNNVTILDGRSDRIIGSVSLPSQNLIGGPVDILYDPFNGFLAVVESSPAELVLLNGSTNEIVDENAFSVYNNLLAANPVTGNLYAATAVGPSNSQFALAVLNGTSLSTVSRLVMNGTPGAITYDPLSGQVFVASYGQGLPNYYNGTLTELNAAATEEEGGIAVGLLPDGLGVDSANGDLYVTDYYSANISEVNATTFQVTASVPVASNPGPIVYDPMNRCLYTVHIEGLVSIFAPPGAACSAPPRPGLIPMWEMLVLGTAAGAVVAVVVFFVLPSRPEPPASPA